MVNRFGGANDNGMEGREGSTYEEVGDGVGLEVGAALGAGVGAGVISGSGTTMGPASAGGGEYTEVGLGVGGAV